MKTAFIFRTALRDFTLLIFFVFFSLFLPVSSQAKVRGECYKCHTMHNSQNGATVTSGATPSGAPIERLLKTTCVGCHTSNTSETIYDPTGLRVPIVYNTVVPSNPLAGGNFYWVAQGSDAKGHNVYGVGIAGNDDLLTRAPGYNTSGCGTNTCHYSLNAAPQADNWQRGGCQGCHVITYHHDDNAVYRFLKGHGFPAPSTSEGITQARKDYTQTGYNDYVQRETGWEDDDWEQETTVDHNWYKGTNNSYISTGSGLRTQHTVTAFCSGCHSAFHGPYGVQEPDYGMGSSSPWLRHPTDILLPTIGEYSAYKPWDTSLGNTGKYSAEAPVAWLNPNSPASGQAVVMCLSCHRPHGSPNPDLLRWDYTNMIAGDNSKSGGCFTCHTTKNDAP